MRLSTVSSSASMSSAAVSRRPRRSISSPSASAWPTERGKPSSRKPSSPSSSILSKIIEITSSSGTSLPLSMYCLACRPSSVSCLLCSRRRSPVPMYGSPKSSVRREACVPLPAPGGPSRIRFNSLMSIVVRRSLACGDRRAKPYSLQEAFVVAHHELRLELLHGVKGDADHDQDRGAAEVEVRRRLVDEDRRQRRHGRQIQRARERQPREDPVQELGRRAPRAHAG